MPQKPQILPRLRLFFFLLLAAVFNGTAHPAASAQPEVYAVLFYSPTCPHCHYVMEEVLPPLLEQYGDQLNIVAIDVTDQEGGLLYQMMYQAYSLAEDRLGVPALVLGDTVMVGSREIPEKLPGLIESALAAGGADYPAIPGLKQFLKAQGTLSPEQMTVAERFRQDLAGNSLSVLVLLGMLACLAGVIYRFVKKPTQEPAASPSWIVPLLALAGLGVAAYLSYVEITQTDAVCGPVGDCNAVQSSQYARLFGLLPVGLLGLAGYLLILASWLLSRFGPASWRGLASLAVLGLSITGLLFMLYLTFLEPFVIGATCAWCLASAVLMTLIIWFSLDAGLSAWRGLANERSLTGANSLGPPV